MTILKTAARETILSASLDIFQDVWYFLEPQSLLMYQLDVQSISYSFCNS